MQTESPYLTLPEAASYLRVSASCVYQWVHYGLIPVSRAGRRLRFDRKSLDAWMRERERPKRNSSLSRFQTVKALWQSRSLTTEHTSHSSPKSFGQKEKD